MFPRLTADLHIFESFTLFAWYRIIAGLLLLAIGI
jgi:hypothetical protein